MKPLQPITNPLGNPLGHFESPIYVSRIGEDKNVFRLEEDSGMMANAYWHREPFTFLVKREIPLGALIQLNPRLLK